MYRRATIRASCGSPFRAMSLDQRAKPVAALIETGELVPTRAGRRQQHDVGGTVARERSRLRRPPLPACRHRDAARLARPASPPAPARRARSGARRRCAGRIGASDSMPPSLAMPPAIQITPVVAGQRAGRGIGIGRLAVIDEANAVDVAHRLLAMRQAGIGRDAARQSSRAAHPAPAPSRPPPRRSARYARPAAHAPAPDRQMSPWASRSTPFCAVMSAAPLPEIVTDMRLALAQLARPWRGCAHRPRRPRRYPPARCRAKIASLAPA